MKKIILLSAMISIVIVLLAPSISVKAQCNKSTSTTVVSKDSSITPNICCKTGATTTCDKSKCDKSKCDKSKCTNSGTNCSNNSGCKMGKTSNKVSPKAARSSYCDAMKNKTKCTSTE